MAGCTLIRYTRVSLSYWREKMRELWITKYSRGSDSNYNFLLYALMTKVVRYCIGTALSVHLAS